MSTYDHAASGTCACALTGTAIYASTHSHPPMKLAWIQSIKCSTVMLLVTRNGASPSSARQSHYG